MQGSFCAFLDSNVLYPVSLRNLLMRLALAGLYQARWSADIHDEWIRAVLQDRTDISKERLEAIRAAMDREAEGRNRDRLSASDRGTRAPGPR